MIADSQPTPLPADVLNKAQQRPYLAPAEGGNQP
jgi:hypothetical protein